jgi:hypothetical protein
MDEATAPDGAEEDMRVVAEGELMRPEAQPAGDLEIGLEAHVHQPVDRQEQDDQIDHDPDVASLEAHHAPFR